MKWFHQTRPINNYTCVNYTIWLMTFVLKTCSDGFFKNTSHICLCVSYVTHLNRLQSFDTGCMVTGNPTHVCPLTLQHYWSLGTPIKFRVIPSIWPCKHFISVFQVWRDDLPAIQPRSNFPLSHNSIPDASKSGEVHFILCGSQEIGDRGEWVESKRKEKRKQNWLCSFNSSVVMKHAIIPTVMELEDSSRVSSPWLWGAEKTSGQSKCDSSDRCWFMMALLPSALLSLSTIRLHLQSSDWMWSAIHPYTLLSTAKIVDRVTADSKK